MSDTVTKGKTTPGAGWMVGFEERDALVKIRNCAIAALISAIFTTGFAVASLFVSADTAGSTLSYYLDPWAFVDGALILALAATIYFRNSFKAAVILLIYFLFAKIVGVIETGSFKGSIMALVFVYFYWQGVVGTRELRSLRGSPPERRGPRRFVLRTLGGITAALFLLLIGWGMLMTLKIVPNLEMMEGDDIPQKYAIALREKGILEDGETLEIFYSAAFLSILEDGNLMTGRRVISYEETDEELAVESASYDEISHILISRDGSAFEDSLLEVVRKDGSSFYLWMTVEDEAHLIFMDVLRRKIAAVD